MAGSARADTHVSDALGQGWRQPPLFSAPGIIRDPRLEHRTTPAAVLARDFSEGRIIVPPFARQTGQWGRRQASAFIETLLLGLPVTPIVFVRDSSGLVVVDGLQRIRAISDFLNNDLDLTSLTQLRDLDSRRFEQLPLEIQQQFLEVHLPCTIASGPDPQSLAPELFRRLNETALALSEAELRAVSLNGAFYRFAQYCADMPLFRELVDRKGSAPNDAERLELALRFFAFSDRYERFSHEVAAFIDDYIADMNREHFPHERMLREFTDTMMYVKSRFLYGFRKSPGDDRVPRVRFEAIAVGVNLAMREGIESNPDLSWLDSEEFKNVTRTEASNSKVRLSARVGFVRKRLLRQR